MATIKEFKKNYIKAIQEGYAAIFAGAGLSRASGFVNWKELLRDIADEISLDVDKETDLIEVAQFYCNESGGRAGINEKILNRFVSNSQFNESLSLLADMPITTYWTTNYDHLIEDTLKSHGKKVDVKLTSQNLALTLSEKDIIVYKMHGDYLNPATCVITKDDYELYNEKRKLFTTALQGDLVSKTFLFIGFSFGDPNMKYILSRIRNLLDENRRTHYCFLQKINRNHYTSEEDYAYDLNKQNLRIHDLKRYGINAVLLHSYSEIPGILYDIRKAIKNKCIFISGAAHEYGEPWEKTGPLFIRLLTKALYNDNYKIITGHARGVGSDIISTMIEESHNNVSALEKHLLIKAFPYEDKQRPDYEDIKYQYRESFFHEAGIAIFLFGNKESSNKTVLADGVYEEFKIAQSLDSYIIPIGSTGYIAKKIHSEIESNIEKYPYLENYMNILGSSTDMKILIETVLKILHEIQSIY